MKLPTFRHTLLVLSLLFGYLFLSLFSLNHMGNMAGMNMSMANCPYLPFQHSDGNTLADHLAAWSDFSSVITSSFFLFFAILLAGLFPRLDRSALLSPLTLAPSRKPSFRPPIVSLFAAGILHPSIP